LLQSLNDIANFSVIAHITGKTIKDAFAVNWSDTEDAIQYYSALSTKADVIVTRNEKDFILSEIAIFTPSKFLAGFR
jgi:predicted nucleic acid-binding protein